MPKRKEIRIPTMMNKPRVIIYDDENIEYIIGNGASFDWERQSMTYEGIDGSKKCFPLNSIVTMGIDDAVCLENIKLDDTLMRRIAEFNKSQECKRLDKEIHDKRQRIDEIEAILEDREHRLTKLKDFIRNIYMIDVDDDDDDDWDD